MPLTALVAGLALGLTLIIAIGAQNLFVLRQGIRREHVFVVAAVCAISDLVLIMVGVSGVGAVLGAMPWLVEVIRWAGAAFLVTYGVLAARRALTPSGAALRTGGATGESPETTDAPGSGTGGASARVIETDAPPVVSPARTSLRVAVLTCLALTWLNPHVYLDTVFMLGSIANTHGDERWWFAAGAGAASLLWFFGLAYGARLLSGVLASPLAWRVLDAIIAVIMVSLGVLLVLPR